MRNMRLNTLESELQTVHAKKSLSLKRLPPPLVRQRAYTMDNESDQFPLMSSKQQLIPQPNHKKTPSKMTSIVASTCKLSPIKQYQTKLNISAQRWLVYDYRLNKYKRGWKPAEVGDFTGMIRQLILRVFIQLQKNNERVKQVNVRINTLYLKEQIDLAKQRKLSPSKKTGLVRLDAISRILQQNMIINIIDLIYGLILTNYDDLLEYAIIFVGYLCYCDMFDVQPVLTSCHFVEKVAQAKAYADYFAQYVTEKLCVLLQLKNTCFYAENYYFESSPNDICSMFLQTEHCALYKKFATAAEHKAKVKYQLGYNFWENRTLHFKNKRPELPATLNGYHYEFVTNWKGKRNYASIVKNKSMDILIVLQDSKFGMFQLDVRCVENWVKEIRKPVVGEVQGREGRKGKYLAPLLKIADINNDGVSKLKRVNTETL